jgi:HK97 gp10 family phage protein
VKILNMERLKRKLDRIPDVVKKRAQADLMLAGREINMLQRSLAPHEDGDLRESIRTEALDDGTVGVAIRAGGPLTTKPVRKSEKGNAPTYDYALAQELGTKDMAPNPFFWPGYKGRKAKARRAVRAGVKRALKEAVSGD